MMAPLRPHMVQARGTTGIIVLAAALWAVPVRAGPVSGVFTGALGRIAFETEARGRVVGRYADGGPCGFDLRRPVVDGELEGDVLVGVVTLCQTGPACGERAYPILAFRLPDGSLSAHVKLEPGCQSPALEGARMVLRPAPDQSVELAADKKRPKKSNAACVEIVNKATQLLPKHDFAGASFYFAEGLACNDQNWIAHLGLAIAELRRENDYNRACAYSHVGQQDKALQALSRAVDLGWADPKGMVDDPDLRPLRELPEFKALVDRAWDLKERQPVGEDHP
jgi:hypothetical protein